MLFDEPERDEFIRKIAAASTRLISVGTLIEASIVMEARVDIPRSFCRRRFRVD